MLAALLRSAREDAPPPSREELLRIGAALARGEEIPNAPISLARERLEELGRREDVAIREALRSLDAAALARTRRDVRRVREDAYAMRPPLLLVPALSPAEWQPGSTGFLLAAYDGRVTADDVRAAVATMGAGLAALDSLLSKMESAAADVIPIPGARTVPEAVLHTMPRVVADLPWVTGDVLRCWAVWRGVEPVEPDGGRDGKWEGRRKAYDARLRRARPAGGISAPARHKFTLRH